MESSQTPHLENNLTKSKYEMMMMDQAIQTMIEKCVGQFESKRRVVQLNLNDQSLDGSILAQDIFAKDDLPPFRASVMDGYAVSTLNDSLEYEIYNKTSFAGQASKELETYKFGQNECLYVTTGAPVPEFFDCVIPIENVEYLNNEKMIKINSKGVSGKWIRPCGSDIAKNQLVLSKG